MKLDIGSITQKSFDSFQISTSRPSDSFAEPPHAGQQQLTFEPKWLGQPTITRQPPQSQYAIKDIAQRAPKTAPAAQLALAIAQFIVRRSRLGQIAEELNATRCCVLQEAARSLAENPSGGQ